MYNLYRQKLPGLSHNFILGWTQGSGSGIEEFLEVIFVFRARNAFIKSLLVCAESEQCVTNLQGKQ